VRFVDETSRFNSLTDLPATLSTSAPPSSTHTSLDAHERLAPSFTQNHSDPTLPSTASPELRIRSHDILPSAVESIYAHDSYGSVADHYIRRQDTFRSPSETVVERERTSSIPSSIDDSFGRPKRARLDDHQIYRLMRHYVEVVGPWLDLTDSRRHYSTVVPQLALKCPVLLNAILAFSARQLHRLEGYEAMIAEYYHNEAIKVMIPMLQDQRVANNGALLATTIILRMYETLERKAAPPEIRLFWPADGSKFSSFRKRRPTTSGWHLFSHRR
jgi:hypothetical protein